MKKSFGYHMTVLTARRMLIQIWNAYGFDFILDTLSNYMRSESREKTNTPYFRALHSEVSIILRRMKRIYSYMLLTWDKKFTRKHRGF